MGLRKERWGRTFRDFSQCPSLFPEIYYQSYSTPLSALDCFFDPVNEVRTASTYIRTTIRQLLLRGGVKDRQEGEEERPRTIHPNHYIRHVPSLLIPSLDPLRMRDYQRCTPFDLRLGGGMFRGLGE